MFNNMNWGIADETITSDACAGLAADSSLGAWPEPGNAIAGTGGRSLLAANSRDLDIRRGRRYRHGCAKQRVGHPSPRHGDGEKSVLHTGARGDAVRCVGQFVSPHNIATDSNGNLYVAEDLGGQRVQKFVLKGMSGSPQR